jgi:peptidyl-prolyl cis-trans isomerase A (cyclophilin A)
MRATLPLVIRLALVTLCACVAAGAATAASPPPLLHPETLHAKAPATYRVSFKTTKGTFVVTVHRAWSPRGADRFYNLARAHFFDGVTFFRVVKGFVVQFGISGFPSVSTAWQNANIKDDPVQASNTVGTITYADAGPNTRTTQVFINLGNNAANLDHLGFAPFGKVTTGMAVVQKLYGGYGEQVTNLQGNIAAQGNAFLEKRFPKLDSVIRARIVQAH